MKNVLVLGGENHMNWMKDLGFIAVDSIDKANFVFFTGGTDVNPDFYKQPKHITTQHSDYARDNYEKKIFGICKELGLGMLGICRGHQFLAVMNGAELIQDSQHPYMHNITLIDGRVIRSNSTHHQQVNLLNVDPSKYKLLGWAENISKYHEDGYGEVKVPKDYKEPEIIWWPETRCLTTQGHCESMSNDDIYPVTMREFVVKYFLS